MGVIGHLYGWAQTRISSPSLTLTSPPQTSSAPVRRRRWLIRCLICWTSPKVKKQRREKSPSKRVTAETNQPAKKNQRVALAQRARPQWRRSRMSL